MESTVPFTELDPPGEVPELRVFFQPLSDPDDSGGSGGTDDADRCPEALDADERARWQALIPPRARRLFAASRRFLRQTLSRLHPETAPAAWRFSREPKGRPGLAAPFDRLGMDFSLSHTDGMVAVAVATRTGGGEPGRIGVDVESTARDRHDPLVLARRFFAPEEAGHIAAAPDAATRRNRFLVLWTLKESRLKATGEGLSGGLAEPPFVPSPDGFVTPEDDGGRLRLATATLATPAPGWHFRSFRLGNGYWAAAAYRGAEPDWRIELAEPLG